MAELRFGVVSESVLHGRAWLDHARRIEDAGIDVLLIRDHFSAGAFGQQLAPFTALASAAAVTTRLRVGTIVLSNDFRHPAIVAHEAASLHLVSGGRFELGLGAGWYQPEYDAAGIGFDPAGQRIGRLEESLGIIRALLVRHRGAPLRHLVPGRGPGPRRAPGTAQFPAAAGRRGRPAHAAPGRPSCGHRGGASRADQELAGRGRRPRRPAAAGVRRQARRAPRGGRRPVPEAWRSTPSGRSSSRTPGAPAPRS